MVDNTPLLYFYSTIAQSFAALVALSLIFWSNFRDKEIRYILFIANPLHQLVANFSVFYKGVFNDSNYVYFKDTLERFKRSIDANNGTMTIIEFGKLNQLIANNPMSDEDKYYSKFLEFKCDLELHAFPMEQHILLLRRINKFIHRFCLICLILVIAPLLLILGLYGKAVTPLEINISNAFIILLAVISLYYLFYIVYNILNDDPQVRITKRPTNSRFQKRTTKTPASLSSRPERK
jgi:hypothetical protein